MGNDEFHTGCLVFGSLGNLGPLAWDKFDKWVWKK